MVTYSTFRTVECRMRLLIGSLFTMHELLIRSVAIVRLFHFTFKKHMILLMKKGSLSHLEKTLGTYAFPNLNPSVGPENS